MKCLIKKQPQHAALEVNRSQRIHCPLTCDEVKNPSHFYTVTHIDPICNWKLVGGQITQSLSACGIFYDSVLVRDRAAKSQDVDMEDGTFVLAGILWRRLELQLGSAVLHGHVLSVAR